VVSIAVLVIGVPLLVWWVGGRRFWGRLRPGADPDPWGDRMRRFGLTPGEAAQVESAVAWGVELHDDRLRRAAVTLAAGVLVTVWAMNPDEIPWGLLVVWLLTSPLWILMVRGPRRAVVLNSDPSA
jgi:hypothetical protein